MMKLLKSGRYADFAGRLAGAETVYGPVRQGERVVYRRITGVDELAKDFVVPETSPKSFVFPKVEKLFGYTTGKEGVVVEDIDLDAIPERVIFGVRPCDAAAMESIGSIFEWEPADPIFETRRRRTTIVAMACTASDDYCFCTSVGGSPEGRAGADVLMTPLVGGDCLVETLTDKGEKLLAVAVDLLDEAPADPEKQLADVPRRFDDAGLDEKLASVFDNAVFDDYAARCIGCSACAFVCPTCACFDIQDEARGSRGQRLRSWDSCGAKLFTLHTSGHNPRNTQGARWRQRLMHKFSYMPQRLDIRGCVGCGRCSRRCPVDMNISESIGIIAGL
ncbi:MAG: 4Fe-4S dicluster domain-containing protein [Rikenellaceae bacterium]|jgi:ferredoxin|nr:4Fe-4S dicluster domain-containing protein [Rikenellaceae bacterium]